MYSLFNFQKNSFTVKEHFEQIFYLCGFEDFLKQTCSFFQQISLKRGKPIESNRSLFNVSRFLLFMANSRWSFEEKINAGFIRSKNKRGRVSKQQNICEEGGSLHTSSRCSKLLGIWQYSQLMNRTRSGL